MTEVEIKLRVASREAHARVAELFAAGHVAIHEQENFFFDGSKQELAAQRAVLRLRFYNTSSSSSGDGKSPSRRCVLTLKGKSVIQNGVGVAPEVEHDMSVDDGQRCIEDPRRIFSITDTSAASGGVPSAIIRDVVERFKVDTFVCLGGFTNRRQVYKWRVCDDEAGAGAHVPDGVLYVELDETRFAHATLFEVEVETDCPELVKPILEKKLRASGVDFSDSDRSKFAIFREQQKDKEQADRAATT